MQIEHIRHFFIQPNSTQSKKKKINKNYKTLKRPVATYKAESWTLNKDIAKQLASLKTKSFKKKNVWGN
jgi:hypothetical protein